MTHLERLPGTRRSSSPCPITLLANASFGEAAREALTGLGLLNPLTVTAVDPSVPLEGRPCLILLDLQDNPLRGLAFLGALRARRDLAHVPLLAFGPEDDAALVEQAYAFGARSYLARPTAHAELVERLRVVLDYWLRISRTPD